LVSTKWWTWMGHWPPSNCCVRASRYAIAGKTRLLDELGSAAAGRSLTTLRGRAAEFEQELPFGMVIDALDDHLEICAGQVRENLGPAATQLLCGLFPGLSRGAGYEPDIQPQRFRPLSAASYDSTPAGGTRGLSATGRVGIYAWDSEEIWFEVADSSGDFLAPALSGTTATHTINISYDGLRVLYTLVNLGPGQYVHNPGVYEWLP
jgi:hypothetical protein